MYLSNIPSSGDHQQLRPKIKNYDLSVENPHSKTYDLDVSLFERLCSSGVSSTSGDKLGFPLTQLTVQRRMRPEIADLIRNPLYWDLLDHQCVKQYPRVAGMFHDLYWFNHEQEEDGMGEMDVKDTSRSNVYEVEMVTQFVSYLCKQNIYKDGDVVVITPYSGQLRKFRDSLGNILSVQLSDEDQEALAVLDSLEAAQNATSIIERKPLAQRVRIATVTPSS